ncbi:MAG: hypothetical protein ABIF40_04970 [archaeon]
MTDLVANLSTGKGTWGHVGRLINEKDWTNIYLITNEFGQKNFTTEKKVNFIVINPITPLEEIKNYITAELKDKLKNEVALNVVSGSGKEHMAIIAALFNLGIGIRLIAITQDGIKEI